MRCAINSGFEGGNEAWTISGDANGDIFTLIECLLVETW
jgi:hypothetical protein